MKIFYNCITAAILFTTAIIPRQTNAQPPDKMSYQAVVRNSAGALVVNRPVGIRIQILQGSATGNSVYTETHSLTTNVNGLVSMEVGGGTVVSGSFPGIEWSTGPYFIKTEADPDGGTSYSITGVSQLLSVPYALYSKYSETPGPKGDKGDTGVAGPAGSVWLTGSGPAAVFIGEINDMYLNTLNGDYYKKTDTNTWTYQGNLAGPQGIPGEDGATWLTGNGVPNGSDGKIDDLYLDTFSGGYYKKIDNNTWAFQNNLIGPKGNKGTSWVTGSGTPSGSIGNENDLYLDISTGDHYKKTGSGTWMLEGNFKNSVNISGTKNYVVKFTSPTTIGNSQLFDDGKNVGINTIAPQGKLHIQGNTDVPQLLIDANQTQTKENPIILIRGADKKELFRLHSDNNTYNLYLGFQAGWSSESTKPLHVGNTYIGRQSGFSDTAGGGNTAVGYQTLVLNRYGTYNSAFGTGALGNTIGYYNTGVGGLALANNKEGEDNSALGYRTLWTNRDGNYNTAIGNYALYWNSSGSKATAVGYGAMQYANNTTTGFENYNVAVGYESLRGSTTASANTGNHNTALGFQTLYANTSGNNNTAIGTWSLYSNTTGNYNTASGVGTLVNNTTASRNISVGYNALFSQSYSNSNMAWGSDNVAIGYEALYSNQPTSIYNGIDNTGIGNYVLRSNTTGKNNTATGTDALYSNTTGSNNTANGTMALYSNTTASYNTAIGQQALYYNFSGSANTALGFNSLYHNKNADGNTAIGNAALHFNENGYNNTANGCGALTSNENGNYNTAVGYGADVNAATYSNSCAFGNDATITASNQVRIGNSSVTSIGGQVGWSTLSDARIKSNVMENTVPGLAFIIKLKPVTYTYDINAIEKITWPNRRTNSAPVILNLNQPSKTTTRFTGFLAQDVEDAAKSIGYEFSGVDAPDNETDLYGLRYAEFVVPLVKAVQEQQGIIETQNRQIGDLVKENEDQKRQNEGQNKTLAELQKQITELQGRQAK